MGEQFDRRYRISPDYTENLGNLRKQRFVEQEQMRKQAELVWRPSNIVFFEREMYEGGEKRSLPRVGYFCNVVPSEVVWACGAEAVRLDCGNAAAALSGEESFAGEICPVAKASFGMFLRKESLANSCDVLVLPTTCDAKTKMGEVLNDFKPVFMLSVPKEQNHRLYAAQSHFELKRLVQFLERECKGRVSTFSLGKAIALGVERSRLVRALQEVRIRNPQAFSIRDFFLMIQVSLFRPVSLEVWLEEVRKTLVEVEGREGGRKSLRPRLVLTGAPMIWPNFKVLNILEECGADIVADTLCTGAQSCFDPVVVDEKNKRDLLRAIANKYLFASICPCFVSQFRRIDRVIELYEECGAVGVVNYSLRLCQLFDMENYRLARILKGRGIPYINVRTDYSLEDTEQLRVRIESFLETLL